MPRWRWLLFILLITTLKISSSFSQTNNCSLTGGWYDDDPEGGTGEWSLLQDGSNLTGFWDDHGYPDQECGMLLVAGTAGQIGRVHV